MCVLLSYCHHLTQCVADFGFAFCCSYPVERQGTLAEVSPPLLIVTHGLAANPVRVCLSLCLRFNISIALLSTHESAVSAVNSGRKPLPLMMGASELSL